MKPPIHPIALVLAAVAFVGFGESLHAQTPKPTKVVKEAERMAEGLQYVDAIRLLELAMLEGDTSEALIFDLANYYKKTGNLRMATSLCKPLVDKLRPRPWHLLEVSTMLIEQGRVKEAEPYLARFEELKPQDPRAGALRNYALSRRNIARRYPNARLDTFLHNTQADDNFPFVHDDVVYWSSDRAGTRKISGWTGRAMVGLYTTRLAAESGTYGADQRLDARFNHGDANTASACLRADGQRIYYSANAERPNRHGELNMQLYSADQKGGEWRGSERVPGQFDQANCLHPALSADGEWLYFSSDAPESRGGLDLYRMAVRADGTFGRPENLGAAVNTERHDAFPVAGRDGKLYFASQGHLGLGGFDLFETYQLSDGTWATPANLGEPINSQDDETGWLPVRGGQAYLVSNRDGGDDDIYEVRW